MKGNTDIFHTEEGIIMKQNDHRDELEEIKIDNNKDPDRELNLNECAKFQGMLAREPDLTWLKICYQ